MRKESREALDAYFAEADSWAKDRNDALRGSRRLAWLVAGVAMALAIVEAIALVLLLPLKTVEPHALLIDRNTGFVQDVNLDQPTQRLSENAALTQSFLVQYVVARESFDIDTINTNYRKVAALSAEQARADYLDHVQPSSPDSPLVRYPRSTVDVRVKSVSPIEQNVSLVRFDTVRRDPGGRWGEPSHWVAVIRYRYSGEPARVEDRYQNPLGFQVVRYRVDAEALPNEDAAPPARVAPTPVQVAPPPRVVPVPVVPQPQPPRPQPVRRDPSGTEITL